jgi:hypothetical protein
MLRDKAYDSAKLRDDLDQRGTKPVIPNRCRGRSFVRAAPTAMGIFDSRS